MKWAIPKQLIIEIVAGLFVLLFLYTAIMKLKDTRIFINTMSQIPLLRPYAALLGGLIPGMEMAIAILLIIPATRFWGLLLACGLMAIFTLYVGYILYVMKELPCSCGGVLRQMSWREHLLFNLSFLIGGIMAIVINKKIIAINRSSRIPVI